MMVRDRRRFSKVPPKPIARFVAWRWLSTDSYPGGVQQIAVKDVVRDASIQDYQVLPREAGLLRLIQDGTLEVVGVDNFKIAPKMRYPGGLTRLNRVRFTFKEGVPQPDGNPGGSCVILEEGSRLLEGGPECRVPAQP